MIRRGFTLAELLVVISIIALLSSVILSVLSNARMRARDTQRIANARQLSIALEQYAITNSTYKVAGAGESNGGGGYVAKVGGTYTTAIISALKSSGNYSSDLLVDPVYGTDNYYLGQCASTSAYTLYLKVEQDEIKSATSTLSAACDGATAVGLGFNYIAGFGGAGGAGIGGAGGGVPYVAAAGVVDTSFVVGTGFNGEVFSLEKQSDGKVLAGGDFTAYNGTGRSRMARLNSDGSLDSSFNPGGGPDGTIYAIKVLSTGKIMIGGNFLNYNGTAISRVARLNADGTLDTSFNPGTGPNSYVNDLEIMSDDTVFIAGGFSMFNGADGMGVIKLLPSGLRDNSFDSTSAGTNGGGKVLAIQSDGKVILTGSFTVYKGYARAHIVRLNTTGSVDSSFDPGTGFTGSPYAITMRGDGKSIVVGTFTAYNGASRTDLVILNTNGSLDTSLDAGSWTNTIPRAVAALSDGNIMVVGATTWDTAVPDYVVRFLPTGAADTTFNYNKAGTNGVVDALLVLPDGTMLIGGNFTTYNGVVINRIAKLK